MHKKEKKTAKRTSIRKQFAGIFIGLMAGTILLCWFLNSGFLQKYYISNKKAVLMRMYEELGEAVANDEIDTDEYQLSLQQQCSKYNLSLLVLNANSEVVADSGGGSEFLKQQLLQHLFALSGEKYEIMENGNNYIVARVSDSRAQMEYIESWGILTGGYFFIVRSALEGIRDSAKIANTFLASVGIFSAIISGIVIWIVSRRVTTPILQLADISERMCHLDFEARYSGNSKNEIGIHSIRGGTIVGEHEIIFAGHDEIITISHSARSKELFATGAINAALFLEGKPAGLYNMRQLVDAK